MFAFALTFLIILIASVGNLCLGYATALFIGRGPKTLWPLAQSPTPRASEAAAKQTENIPDQEESEEPAAAEEEAIQEETTTEAATTSEDTPSDENENTKEQKDDNLAELMDGEYASIQFGEEEKEPTPAKESLQQIIQAIRNFENELIQSDHQLRNGASEAGAESLQAVSSEVTTVVQGYLENLKASIQPLKDVGAEDPSLTETSEQLQGMINALASRFNLTLNALNQKLIQEVEPDLMREKIFNASRELLDIFHETRMQLTGPLLSFVSNDPNSTDYYNSLLSDEKSSLSGNLRFDMILATWNGEETDPKKPMHVGMLDLDGLRSLNEKHGPWAGNQILEAIREQVITVWDGSENYVQLENQLFVAFFSGLEWDKAIEKVERARQIIEKTTFQLGEEKVNTTLSGALCEVQEGETGQDLLTRLRSALQEAKAAGRNQSFLVRDGTTEPVAPLDLEIEEQLTSL